jgi:hypothetical protein
MNRARPAHPKIATLLNTPTFISKRNLSGYLWFHIHENGLLHEDGCHKYVRLDKTLAELLKAPVSSKIVLFEHNKKIVDWWDVVERILKNWQ